MKKISIFYALILVLSCEAVSRQGVVESLRDELQTHYDSSDLPGFAVSLLTADKVLFQAEFGYADTKTKRFYTSSTIQNIGSVSKTVVGMALVKAIEGGYLTLDTEINEILPFEVTNPKYPDVPILVRHLANHTSSILDAKYYANSYINADIKDDREGVHEDFSNFLGTHMDISVNLFLKQSLSKGGQWYKKKNFSKSKPGETSEYSNVNAALAAYLVEIASGVPFKAYVKAEIFDPLEMHATGWSLAEIDLDKHATLYFPRKAIVPWYTLVTYADGGLITSLEDMNLYLMEVIKAYSGNSSFLNAQYAKMMLPGDDDEDRVFWGMGTASRNIGHSGSDPGVQTDVHFNADSKIGRIIFTNVNAEDNEVTDKQYNQIHAILKKYEAKLN